jgi:hypothetical protein
MKANTTIRNGDLFCLNCGGSHKLQMPVAVEVITKKIEAFNELHADCEPTWKESEITRGSSLDEKVLDWLINGETGVSSKTMAEVMTGRPCLKGWHRDHPYDPDDFSRCYKLLKMIPELKALLPKMRSVSEAWSNLVDNWDKLTEMYEQNTQENWKNYKKIGMYELMQKCINPAKEITIQ